MASLQSFVYSSYPEYRVAIGGLQLVQTCDGLFCVAESSSDESYIDASGKRAVRKKPSRAERNKGARGERGGRDRGEGRQRQKLGKTRDHFKGGFRYAYRTQIDIDSMQIVSD